MGATLREEHRQLLNRECTVGILVNAIVPPAIIAGLGVPPPQALFGPEGVLPGLLAASAAATFLMTLIVTLVTRARVRKGAVPRLDWPREQRGWLRYVPNALPLRALVLAARAAVLLVPLGLLLVAVAGLAPFTTTSANLFNVAFGALVGAVATGPIVKLALAD